LGADRAVEEAYLGSAGDPNRARMALDF